MSPDSHLRPWRRGSVSGCGEDHVASTNTPELEELDQILHTKPPCQPKARFMCVPTTSGTASEVSGPVAITDGEAGPQARPGRHIEMMPDIAICDPDVTRKMLLHHAETAWMFLPMRWKRRSNRPITCRHCHPATRSGARDIVRWFPRAYRDGDTGPAR